MSRTQYSNKEPVVIDPRPRCIFVGPRPLQGETYVRYDILEQVWIQWYAFLVRRVRINPRQGSPIAMVRNQPLINVLDSPHMARWPAQYTSTIRQAHGKASTAINNTDEFNAYQAFIASNVFYREPWEDFFKIPSNLEQARLEIEATMRTRASWTLAQQVNKIPNSRNAPSETRSLSLEQVNVLETEPIQGGTMI